MATEISETLFVEVRGRRYEAGSLAEASAMFCIVRDASGLGASQIPAVRVVTASGREIAKISYNGRVWPAGDWRPGMVPLFDSVAA